VTRAIQIADLLLGAVCIMGLLVARKRLQQARDLERRARDAEQRAHRLVEHSLWIHNESKKSQERSLDILSRASEHTDS
jgi:peptide subunit release factor RF-3